MVMMVVMRAVTMIVVMAMMTMIVMVIVIMPMVMRLAGSGMVMTCDSVLAVGVLDCMASVAAAAYRTHQSTSSSFTRISSPAVTCS